MNIFSQLEKNKGTISSALGKKLAEKVLSGNKNILAESIELVIYNPDDKKAKNIRAGAAKIVEIVAEKKPEWVAPYLDKLLPALDLPEPQTRWMIIRTLGFCAQLNYEEAIKALTHAQKYITQKEGLCLTSSAELYLGDIGAISAEDAVTVLPILERAAKNTTVNEVDWILEAFIKISKNLNEKALKRIKLYANNNLNAPKKSTQNRANNLLKILK